MQFYLREIVQAPPSFSFLLPVQPAWWPLNHTFANTMVKIWETSAGFFSPVPSYRCWLPTHRERL